MKSNRDTLSSYFLQLHISMLESAFSKIMLSSKNVPLSLMASTFSIYMFIICCPFDTFCFPVFEFPFSLILYGLLTEIVMLRTHPTTATMLENAFSKTNNAKFPMTVSAFLSLFLCGFLFLSMLLEDNVGVLYPCKSATTISCYRVDHIIAILHSVPLLSERKTRYIILLRKN